MLCLHIGMPILFRLMVKQLLRGQALRLNFSQKLGTLLLPCPLLVQILE